MKTEITTPYIESLVDQLELIETDIQDQFLLKEIDMSCFKKQVRRYINLQDCIQKLKVSLARGPRG